MYQRILPYCIDDVCHILFVLISNVEKLFFREQRLQLFDVGEGFAEIVVHIG